MEAFSYIILLLSSAIFFVNIANRLKQPAIGIIFAVIALALFLEKVFGGGLGALLSGFSIKSTIEIGVRMNRRAAVEFVVTNIAFASGLINRNIYSSIVFMAVTMTLITSLLLKWYIKTLLKNQQYWSSML